MKKQEQSQNPTEPTNKYRVKNCSDYNQALVRRGSIDLYIEPQAMAAKKNIPIRLSKSFSWFKKPSTCAYDS